MKGAHIEKSELAREMAEWISIVEGQKQRLTAVTQQKREDGLQRSDLLFIFICDT